MIVMAGKEESLAEMAPFSNYIEKESSNMALLAFAYVFPVDAGKKWMFLYFLDTIFA